jgi:hypothetical protein
MSFAGDYGKGGHESLGSCRYIDSKWCRLAAVPSFFNQLLKKAPLHGSRLALGSDS